jgi:hypothetical protein
MRRNCYAGARSAIVQFFVYAIIDFPIIIVLAGRMAMVVWTPRDEAVHVMSMRKCNDKEQTRYSKRFEEG